MLQGMVSVFLFGGHAFYESAEFVPISLGPGKSGREIRKLYTEIHSVPSASCIPAGIFAIYMADGKRILP